MVGATSNYSGISEEPAATTDLPTLNRLTASIQLSWVTTCNRVLRESSIDVVFSGLDPGKETCLGPRNVRPRDGDVRLVLRPDRRVRSAL